MRLNSLLLGSLVLATALQPFLGQETKPSVNSADSNTANQLERAWASGFDFSRLSGLNRKSLFPPVVWAETPRALATQGGKDSELCYTMHVFKFKREDGDPPRMTGSTTCTPAKRAGLKVVDGPQRMARYVPQ